MVRKAFKITLIQPQPGLTQIYTELGTHVSINA